MNRIIMSLKDVYNNLERFCHVDVLINLKEIIECKDVEISNCKNTICHRNLLIKQLRRKCWGLEDKINEVTR